MTAPYSPTRTFEVPEYLKREDIGVKDMSLTHRSFVIKYEVNKDMKGEIKILITGRWDADSQQLKTKAWSDSFPELHFKLYLLQISLQSWYFPLYLLQLASEDIA